MSGQEWWLTIFTPDGIHCWPGIPVGDEPRTNELVTRARVLTGCPPGSLRIGADGDLIEAQLRRWRVSLAPGEPHPDAILARATVHELGDLDTVASADLNTYTEEHEAVLAQENSRAALHQIHQLMAHLDDDSRAAVLAHYGQGQEVTDG